MCSIWTHSRLIFPFSTPWKHQKTRHFFLEVQNGKWVTWNGIITSVRSLFRPAFLIVHFDIQYLILYFCFLLFILYVHPTAATRAPSDLPIPEYRFSSVKISDKIKTMIQLRYRYKHILKSTEKCIKWMRSFRMMQSKFVRK